MSWNDPSYLVPFVQKVAKNIEQKPCDWLDQTRKLGCGVKYLDIRIDQRTGHFLVTGKGDDTVVNFHVYDAPHLFPAGWSYKDGINHNLAELANNLNEYLQLELSKEQLKAIAQIIEGKVSWMIKSNAIEIRTSAAIARDKLETNWNEK